MSLFDILNKKLANSNNEEKKQKNLNWKINPVPIFTNTPIQGYSFPMPFSFYIVGGGSFLFEITDEKIFNEEKGHNENTVIELVQNIFANYVNMIGKELTIKSDNMADSVDLNKWIKFINEKTGYSEGFVISSFVIDELCLTDDSKRVLEDIEKRIDKK